MVRLAGAGACLLDPFCGTGTIAIEAVEAGTIARETIVVGTIVSPVNGVAAGGFEAGVLGVDVDPGAVAAAVANTPVPGAIGWAVGDAGRLPVASGSVDVVVGNPPWGRQVAVSGVGAGGGVGRAGGGVGRAGAGFLPEVRRVLVAGGRAVLLVLDGDGLVEGIEGLGLDVVERRPIGLAGARPEIVTLVAVG
jgi:tRNA G10  N-methylase Trm11